MNASPCPARRRLSLALALAAVLSACAGVGPPPSPPPPRLSAADAQRDLRVLQRAFVALHPGLYRHATPAQIDAEFAAAGAAVAGGIDRGAFYLLVNRLAAAVRCGHTWVNPSNQPPAIAAELLDRADKLPVTLRIVARRALVTGSAAAEIRPGAELLAIDGHPTGEVIDALLPYLRADGDADGKRLLQLSSGADGGAMDRLYPLRFPPVRGRYRLRVKDASGAPAREIDVPATTVAARTVAIGAPSESQAWALRFDGDTAVLTLPTFAFWRESFDGAAYLDSVFDTLQARGTPDLIIDIRRNEGGDDALGRALLRHLITTPHTLPGGQRDSAYERVPYALARYLDTWDFDFFDRTGLATRGSGRLWRLSDAPATILPPVARPYGGRTLLLVGPQNSSAGFILARDVKAARAAVLIGQRTAGDQRGLNGGQLAWITLPSSQVAVDIPLVANRTDGDPPEGGVVPDVPVPERYEDAAAGRDAELETARALIARWRAAAAPGTLNAP